MFGVLLNRSVSCRKHLCRHQNRTFNSWWFKKRPISSRYNNTRSFAESFDSLCLHSICSLGHCLCRSLIGFHLFWIVGAFANRILIGTTFFIPFCVLPPLKSGLPCRFNDESINGFFMSSIRIDGNLTCCMKNEAWEMSWWKAADATDSRAPGCIQRSICWRWCD